MARFGSRIKTAAKKTRSAIEQTRDRTEDAADDVADVGKKAVDQSKAAVKTAREKTTDALDDASDAAKDITRTVGGNVTDMANGVAGALDLSEIDPSHVMTGVGDMFFHSNPKLRTRALHLEADCQEALRRFEKKKVVLYVPCSFGILHYRVVLGRLTKMCHSDALDKKLNVSIDVVLQSHGFDSAETLDARVGEIVDGETLREWDKLKHTIDLANAIDRAIYTIAGLTSIAGTAGIGTLVMAGAMSGPAGWTAIGGIGAATSVVAVLTVVASAVIGKVTQERLKDTVEDLFHARADAFLQLRRMTLICDWMRILVPHMDFLKGKEATGEPDKTLEGLKLKSPELWQMSETHKMLAGRDRMHREWTGADPEPRDEFAVMAQDERRSIWKGNYPAFIDRGAEIARDAVNRVGKAGERAKNLADDASGHLMGVRGTVGDFAISRVDGAGEKMKDAFDDIPAKIRFRRL
ncbi:hypothetical protein S40288_11264 [Stachybotrys chartarum IBT 40288]|nr:hypothetical protein S40288_11264 [Stachybotrys chartarum IBT 40288]